MTVNSVKQLGWWRYRYWVAIVLTFCYSIQYLDRVKTSVLAPLIMQDIGMTHAQYGNGVFLMLAFYGPMQAVVGWICDRFGAKKVLLFSIVSWCLVTWWMGYMRSMNEWYVRQAIFGILCATEFVPSARILARWYAKRQRAQAQAALSYSWILTPSWAPLLATALVAAFGTWRPVFFVVAALGVLPLIAIAIWVKNRPEEHESVSEEELCEIYEQEIADGTYTLDEIRNRKISEHKIAAQRNIPLSKILSYPGFIQMTVAYIVIQALYWAAVSWSPTYLKETFGFSLSTMGVWAIIYFCAGVLGSFTGSRLSDRAFGGRRKPIISISYICTFPFLLLLAFFKEGVNPILLLLTLSGAGFFANMAWGPYYAWPAEIFSPEVYAKALGIINAVGYFIGAAGAPLVMSRLIVKTATGADYTNAWIFISALAVIGFLLAVTVKEHKKESSGTALGA